MELLRSTFQIKLSIICSPFSEVHEECKLFVYVEYKSRIHIEFSKEYPRNPPKIEIEPIIGITQDNVVAMERKIDQLLSYTRNRPLVYDIVELVRVHISLTQDWIQEYLVEGKDAFE
jgi:hypothetical protein